MEIEKMFSRILKLFFAQKKHYQSDIQKHLNTWDRNHTWTESQEAEIRKHQKIHAMRDPPYQKTTEAIDWLEKDD